MPAKFSNIALQAGEAMAYYAPCGGGYGDPLDRPARQVLDDVLDDFCTIQHARDAYGVVITPGLALDETATNALRAKARG
jgi:N-methylhydantoinase B